MSKEKVEWYKKTAPTWLETYWDCIKNGFIDLYNYKTNQYEKIPLVVGHEMRLIISKLINDLKDDRFFYDTTESEKRIKFKENLCFQGKAPFYMKPMTMMLHQKVYWEVVYSFKMKNTGLRRFTKTLLLVSRKNGKALALDTNIPTPNGNRKMRDIEIGDYVYSKSGKKTRVTNTSEIFTNHNCYEVTFEDGEKIIADEEHIWRVKTKISKKTIQYVCKSDRKLLRHDYRKCNGYFDITTKEMIDDFKRSRKDGKGIEYKYRVPMNDAVEYEEKKLKLSPYYLGVWLGDGTSESSVITCGRNDIEETTQLLKEVINVEDTIERDNAFYIRCGELKKYDGKLRNTAIQELKRLNVFKNKHIPDIYLHSSIEQRYELLKGLMDTDGYVSKSGQCEFTQKNHILAMQVKELLGSLGIKSTITEKIPKCNGKKCDSVYIVRFYTTKDKSCFKLKRKHERLKEILSPRMLDKSIIDIKKVESVETKCITVEDKESLYLCGNNYTVTHNSTDMASDANYDLFLGSGGQDIVCCSNDDKTAALIWNEIKGMRKRLDIQDELTSNNLVEIRNDKKNITIFRMSEKTQSKDGRNIDKCYYDECHDSKTTEIADACWQSMSVKNEKFFIQLTTEGVLNDMYLDNELKYARGVLNDEIDDIHYLPFLFTQDSDTEMFRDEWSWCKSNPSLIYGVKKWDFIRDQMTKAKHQKSAMITMLCKDFNIKQNSANSWLSNSDVEYIQEEIKLEDFKNCFCFAGVDLAATTDLSSVKILLMKPKSQKKYIFSKYFIPETKIDSDKEGGAKYREWVQKGYVDVHEGNQVSLQKIVEWFKYLGVTYGIKVYKLGYDQRFATDFLSGMEQIGYGSKKGEVCEMIFQSRQVLSNPMKIVEAELKSQNIHGLNEMDIWCLLNTALDVDGREMIMPIKMKNDKKIDGSLSLIMAYAVFDRYKTDYLKYINGEG